jgi:hypothetical protein
LLVDHAEDAGELAVAAIDRVVGANDLSGGESAPASMSRSPAAASSSRMLCRCIFNPIISFLPSRVVAGTARSSVQSP